MLMGEAIKPISITHVKHINNVIATIPSQFHYLIAAFMYIIDDITDLNDFKIRIFSFTSLNI